MKFWRLDGRGLYRFFEVDQIHFLFDFMQIFIIIHTFLDAFEQISIFQNVSGYDFPGNGE